MKLKQLDAVFTEVYKVSELTIPTTTASVERCFTAFKRIKTLELHKDKFNLAIYYLSIRVYLDPCKSGCQKNFTKM